MGKNQESQHAEILARQLPPRETPIVIPNFMLPDEIPRNKRSYNNMAMHIGTLYALTKAADHSHDHMKKWADFLGQLEGEGGNYISVKAAPSLEESSRQEQEIHKITKYRLVIALRSHEIEAAIKEIEAKGYIPESVIPSLDEKVAVSYPAVRSFGKEPDTWNFICPTCGIGRSMKRRKKSNIRGSLIRAECCGTLRLAPYRCEPISSDL